MGGSSPHDITRILQELGGENAGGRAAADRLFEAVHGELRRMAGGFMRREREDHTLQPTALVHEAYLRLVDDAVVEWENRAHFFGIAARAMRQVLIEHARRRGTAKRGGGWHRVTLAGLQVTAASDVEILDLEEALQQLEKMDGRMARVAELRLFGGLKMKEVAHVTGISRRTVQEDWRVARLWLAHQLSGEGAE
jgi:RNA polymerase sigma factor (TIGR02999 family)